MLITLFPIVYEKMCQQMPLEKKQEYVGTTSTENKITVQLLGISDMNIAN